MKKLVCILLPLLLIGNLAFTADNQSAAWVRSLCREAATDSVDATYYNPAGTAFLDKGLHLQVMNMSVLQNYSHYSVSTSTTYVANTPVWFFPTARMAYNGGSWAAFFDFSIPEGGGSLDYAEGVYALDPPTSTGGSMKGSSAVFGFSLGGSYRIGDMISIGASGRILYGSDGKDISLNATGGSAAATATGIGFGGMFGVDIIPFDGFTFAVTVETGSTLEMEYTEVTGDPTTVAAVGTPAFGIAVGNTYDADLPWRVRTGISYETPFDLTVSSTFKYDLYEVMDDTLRNTWTVAGGLAYDISDRFEISIGGSYDIDEVPDVENYDPINPQLSSFTVAGGVGVEVIEGLVIDVGCLKVFYQDESASGAGGFTDMDKDVVLVALGATYSF